MKEISFHPRTDIYANLFEHRYEFWKVNRYYENDHLYHEEELISFLNFDCTRDEMTTWLCMLFGISTQTVFNMIRDQVALWEEVLEDKLC